MYKELTTGYSMYFTVLPFANDESSVRLKAFAVFRRDFRE